MLNTPAVSNLNIRPSADGQSYVDGLSTTGKPEDDANPDVLISGNNASDQPIREDADENDSLNKSSVKPQSPTQEADQEPSKSPVFLTETNNPADDSLTERAESQALDDDNDTQSAEKPSQSQGKTLDDDRESQAEEKPPDTRKETPEAGEADSQNGDSPTEQPAAEQQNEQKSREPDETSRVVNWYVSSVPEFRRR